MAFHLEIDNNLVRVCKLFFKNTLAITDRMIRTTIAKIQNGLLNEERRGQHGKQRKLNPAIEESIGKHIESFSQIESTTSEIKRAVNTSMDQCTFCEAFNNADIQQKILMQAEELCTVACFDSQAILPNPCGEMSDFYYKSKLATLANRRTNEVATCVFNFLIDEFEGCGDIILFSDNCIQA
ncbi:hypothetical protein ILUMI_26201 [Ignelater luminosus]|uniref:Uncharacterized protein n=1 Tax=Ignelater luminosus TaxID=2038154 RepID=A0A8K0C4J6_IGNLU|nr:hypothetical protein ILUMI_26201 [Ignelater luminosus]